jgi:iron complex outermembrane recepter protein
MSSKQALHALLWCSVSMVALVCGRANAQTFTFDIPAESLSASLHEYARISGKQIVFTNDLVAGYTSRALHGSYDPSEALSQLLAGTGLSAERSASGALMIRRDRHAADDQPATSPVAGQVGEAAPVERVVVTGTNISGTSLVGSNLSTVTTEDIAKSGAQTVGQMLLNVPSITGMGLIGQGQTNNSYFQPTIHQLGGSSSNTTLILFDGHRPVTGGTNHSNEVDPNVIPLNMIDRVDVLAEGSSSIYGSDAIAGVINFITRKQFDGVQLNLQSSVLRGATDFSGGLLMGTSSEHNSIIFGWQYTNLGAVRDTSQPWTFPNHAAQGGTNFLSDNCDPATIQPNSTGSAYYVNAQGTATISSAQSSAICSTWQYGDLAPKEVRDNFMLKGSQDLGQNLTVSADLAYATLRDTATTARGTVTATAFGTGAQANPFYENPPGVTATKQTIRWDATALLGPGATATSGVDTAWGDATAEYHIDDNFIVDLLVSVGRTSSFSNTDGTVNTSVANLALNGTSQSGGSTTTPAIPGTSLIINDFPLTAANALDVWDPASSNKTSAAVIKALEDNATRQTYVYGYQQYRLGTNGTVFNLPAGPLKIAAGAEYFRTQLTEFSANANNTGPASVGSTVLNYDFEQDVASGYGELNIPVISEEMSIPFIQKFDIDASGRYDSYDTVGSTANPKLAFGWVANDWLKLRGNLSTSFVAPPVDIRGVNGNGVFGGNTFGGTTNNLNVPVAQFPLVTQEGIPGCTAATVTCNIANLQGVLRKSGDGNVRPEKGHGWSLGFDFNPDFIPGLSAQVTLWTTALIGGIDKPQAKQLFQNSTLAGDVTFTPNCATSAQLTALQGAVPLTSPLPACAQYLIQTINTNYLNLKEKGIDAAINYQYTVDNWGTFRIGDSLTQFLYFKESYGPNGTGAYYNVLNTTGSSTTYPSVALQMRANIGWSYDGWSADWFINYTSAYTNWNGNSVIPLTFDANGNPNGGGDHVNANITYDAHVAYDFSGGIFGDDEISISARNVFNQKPPFYNSSPGYDTWVASPLGRILTIALKAKI